MRTPAPSSRRSHRTPPPDARSSSCPRPWTAPPRRGRSTRPAARWRRGRDSRPPTDPRRGGASYPPATETRCTSGRTRATPGPPTRVASSHRRITEDPTRLVARRACRTAPDGCARSRCSSGRRGRRYVGGGASAPRATSCARGATSATELVGRGQRSRVHRRIRRPRDVVRPAVLRRRGRNRAGVERSAGGGRGIESRRGAGDAAAMFPQDARRRCKRRGGR